MNKILFLLLAIIALTSLTLVACNDETQTTTPSATTSAPTKTTTSPTSTTSAPTTTTSTQDTEKYGGVYKQALSVAPARPIGYLSEGANDSGTCAAPAVESLVIVDRTGNARPVLATSWEITDDSKGLVLHLRQGVKFHDGSDFNAEVAKWNLDLMIAAKVGSSTDWKSVDIIDDYTIRINVSEYKNTLLTGLSGRVSQMTSKEYVDKNGIEAARWNPVGTGPFIFDSYERDAKLTYTRNPDYWQKGKPYLDGVEFVVIADATVRKLAFQKGEIHRIQVTGLDAQELQKAGFEMISEGGGTFLFVPDSKDSDSPWSKFDVRLAASYSLDRESLNEALGYGFSVPAYQIYPGFPQTDIANLDKHAYNPTKAIELLKEAGYPNGFKTDMHVFTRVVPNNYSTATAEMFRAVSIDIGIDNPTGGKYEEMRYGNWDGLMNHCITSYTNFASLTTYWTGIQFLDVKLPAGFLEGERAMQASLSPEPELIQNVIKLMHDDVTVIPYMAEMRVNFLGKGVHDPGCNTDSLMWFISQDAWLEPSAR